MMKSIIALLLLFVSVSASYALKIYPNPWIPDTNDGLHGTLSEGITIDELPNTGGEILIYNISGELVRKLIWEIGTTSTKWDGKNDAGEYLASGVYMCVVKDSGVKASKIVIIR